MILNPRTEDPRTEDPRIKDPRIKDPVHGLEFCPKIAPGQNSVLVYWVFWLVHLVFWLVYFMSWTMGLCICHIWYLADMKFVKCFTEITEIFNFIQKNTYIATFLSKNWECGMFYSPILKKCQSFCTYILKYKVTLFIMWKIKPEFGKFHRMGNILHQFLRNLLKPKNILHKCH